MLEQNYNNVIKRMKKACLKSNRKFEDLTLIAVSKTVTLSEINDLYLLKQRDFGENRARDLRDKAIESEQDINWHMIGRLQKNKVKYVVPYASMIHSVDSVDLAKKINDVSIKNNKITNILLQVNISNEASKQGFNEDELDLALKEIASLPAIKIKGLMTMAPFFEDSEKTRPIFKKLKQILVDINNKKIDNVNMDVLSMGMSNDFEVAIEEGATHVRVGRSIFAN